MFKNQFNGLGNAGNDASTRKAGDKDVSSVRLAISNGKNREPLWLTVEAWGDLAPRLASVKRGDRIGVQGRLAIESYTDKDGAKQTAVKIVASDIAYLSAKTDGAGDGDDDDGGVY